MKTINPNVYPKEGFLFRDPQGVRIYGDSWAGVIARVAAYRKRNNFPPGDPRTEVLEQACQRNPALCSESTPAQNEQRRRVSLKGRVMAWLHARTQEKERAYVDEATARARAAVCAGCPQNQSFADNGCASCKAAVKVMRDKLLAGRFSDGRLRFCAFLGEDMTASVWLESQTVAEAELPAHCWRKRTL